MKTREERERELQGMHGDELLRIYNTLCGLPDGTGPPTGTLLIDGILRQEFPETEQDSGNANNANNANSGQ